RMDRDHIAVPQLVARDVHTPAVDRPVPVEYQLAGLSPGGGEAEPDQHVVKAAFEHPQEVLAGNTGLTRSFLVVDPELLLEHSVVATRFLLLAQLHAVLALLLAPAAVFAGRVRA